MNLERAMAAVGAVNPSSPFGQNSKMPGPSYDLPAWECKRGSLLSHDRRSMCHPKTCYAKRGFFRWSHVKDAAYRRLASLTDPAWVEGFAFILNTVYARERHFRWHASGDLQSAQHLQNIIQVAREVPHIKFWLPTHEPYLVDEVLAQRAWSVLPDNLLIRVSADALGALPDATWPLRVRRLPASMVHYHYGTPPKVEGRTVFECRSHDRDNQCGPCRACWSPNAHVVSYPRTTPHGIKRSPQLRIFDE